MYRHSMKSPLIFCGPRIARGESDALVYLYDVFPTLCELASIEPPREIDGRSFAPVVSGEVHAARDTIFLAYRDVQRAVRQGDWKLIRYPKINETQFFNLRDDPDETRNLATTETSRVESMLELLAAQQKLNGDSLPLTAVPPAPRQVTAEQLEKKRRGG